MLRLSRSTSIALLCFAAALTLAPTTASAFCRSTTCTGDCERDEEECKTTGEKLYWASSCIGVSLQKDASEYVPFKYFEQAAQKAFVEWSDLDCETGTATISFSQLDDVSCHEAEYNKSGTNTNVILFQDTRWEYTSADNNLAKTTVTFDNDTGEILDADIEINQANNNFTVSDMNVEYDLQAILTHEIGHLIGLDHTLDFSATMYASYEPGTTDQRSIETDDILAVCDAYPPERAAQCAPEPRGGLGDECGGVAPSDGDDGGDADGDGGGCSACATGTGGSSWLAALGLLGLLIFPVRLAPARRRCSSRVAFGDRFRGRFRARDARREGDR